MLRAWMLAAIAILALGQSVDAQEDLHRQLAEELLLLLNVPKGFEHLVQQVKRMQAEQLKSMSLPPEARPQLEASMNKWMDILFQDMRWDAIRTDIINLYVSVFSQEELRDLLNFYKSPVGSKLVAKMPVLMQESIRLGQMRMEKLRPALLKHLEEELQRIPATK